MTAQFEILTVGYVGDRVAGTVSLVRDGDTIAVLDPGMVASRDLILDPLRGFGVEPGDVTDVVFSHHHPDHTLNAALFPQARFHDFWAIYQDDRWISRAVAEHADGWPLAPSIRLYATPGHTAQDISTVADTADGVVVFTHTWWGEWGPGVDPLAEDQAQLTASRERLLALEPVLIVPGHGGGFVPSGQTPR